MEKKKVSEKSTKTAAKKAVRKELSKTKRSIKKSTAKIMTTAKKKAAKAATKQVDSLKKRLHKRGLAGKSKTKQIIVLQISDGGRWEDYKFYDRNEEEKAWKDKFQMRRDPEFLIYSTRIIKRRVVND